MVYNPLISPYFDTPSELGDVFGGSRVYVACGGAECLRPEIEAFVHNLREGKRGANPDADPQEKITRTGVGASYLGPHHYGAAAEVDGVVFDIIEDMPHDFPVVPFHHAPTVSLWKRCVES